MKPTHIYWFAYFNLNEPSVRYRAKFPLELLQKERGITHSIVYPGYDVKNLSNFIFTFLSVLFFRKKNSIIVFQKIYSTGIYALALKTLLFFRPINTLYDIDDAEYTRRSTKTINYFIRRCSKCATGSTAILEYVQPMNANVHHLTSPVIAYGIYKTELEKVFTIGWIGYYGAHRQSLMELCFPALLQVDFPIKISLLGVTKKIHEEEIRAYFEVNKNITIDTPLNLNWHNEQSIYTHISTFDVGVSPLLDTEFNRGKSAFKMKQCFSCGVPVLASPVGENKKHLKPSLNGYFCNSPAEFLQRIIELKNLNEADFKKFSNHAKATYPEFSMEGYGSDLVEMFS